MPASTIEDDLYWVRLITIASIVIGSIILLKGILPARASIHESVTALRAQHLQIENTIARTREIQAIQTDTTQKSARIQDTLSDHSEGSATIWLPRLAEEHFARFQIATGMIRLNTVQPDSLVPHVAHVFVGVEIPLPRLEEKLKPLLLTIAELEARNPTLRVVDFTITPNPDAPKERSAAINLEALDKN